MKKKILFAIIGIIAAAGIFHFLNQWVGLKDDNPLEQVLEEVIADETGIKIDLTPEK